MALSTTCGVFISTFGFTVHDIYDNYCHRSDLNYSKRKILFFSTKILFLFIFQLGSRLSADAESFVPAQYHRAGSSKTPGGRMSSSSSGQSGNTGGQGGTVLNPQQLNQLPRYMTSCYPFVQGDPGTQAAQAQQQQQTTNTPR